MAKKTAKDIQEELIRRGEEDQPMTADEKPTGAAATAAEVAAGPEDEVKADAMPTPVNNAPEMSGPEDLVTADQPADVSAGAPAGNGTVAGEQVVGTMPTNEAAPVMNNAGDNAAAPGGNWHMDDPYGEDQAVADAQQQQAIADNKVLTDAKAAGMDDADMRRALVNAPDQTARDQMMAEWLASGKLKWGDVKRLQQEAADDLDPEKKAQREKREQRERNIVGLLGMVGALGNLVNATSSRNGRSVQVADLSKPLNEKQTNEYTLRNERLRKLQEAKDKYAGVTGSIIGNANKDYMTRAQQARAEQLARDKMAADEAAKLQAANLAREKMDRQENLEKWKAEQARSLKELESRTRITAARIAASSKGNGKGSGSKTSQSKVYKVDGNSYKIANEVLTDFAVGQLYGILPPKYQEEIRKAKKADGRGRADETSEDGEQYSYDSKVINILLGKYSQDKANHKESPLNYKAFKEWLGVLADSEEAGEAESDHKEDPYGTKGDQGVTDLQYDKEHSYENDSAS